MRDKFFFKGEWIEKGKYKNENPQIWVSYFALENKKCNISFRENANQKIQNLKMLPNTIYLLLDV